MSATHVKALQAFMVRWLHSVIPGLRAISIDRSTGHVRARDALGWRNVGTVADFAALARALGALPL